MHTHEWNNPVRNELLSLPAAQCAPFDAGNRSLRILVSLASEDGVYDLEDLRYDLEDDVLPPQIRLITGHLLERTGVYDLRDLRAALAEAARDEESAPFCPKDCGCATCKAIAESAGLKVDEDESFEKERVKLRGTLRTAARPSPERYALVSIDQIRVYLPDDLDITNERAVARYIHLNLNRVREAALECDGTQVTIASVQTVKAAVPA